MSTKIPVKAIYEYLDMMLGEKWGYIWGTAGVTWTEEKQAAVKNEMAQKYGSKWIGHMVTDCSGVMVYIWKKYGLKIPHGSNSMAKQGYVKDISTTPFPGAAAFVYKEADNDYSHIGIVGADGITVYEAKGTQAGFVTSKATEKRWNRFGRFKDVDYTNTADITEYPTEEVDMEEFYYAEITGDGVRLRSGPGTTYPKVMERNLNKGEKVLVMAYCGNWKFVRVGDKQGYVFGKYVSDPIVCEIPAEPVEKVDEYIMVNTEDFKELIRMCKKFADEFGSLLEVSKDER